jgi:hypothetical protein
MQTSSVPGQRAEVVAKDSVAESIMFAGFPYLLQVGSDRALVPLPSVTTAFGKGPLTWLSPKKLHLTPPPFWKKLV